MPRKKNRRKEIQAARRKAESARKARDRKPTRVGVIAHRNGPTAATMALLANALLRAPNATKEGE